MKVKNYKSYNTLRISVVKFIIMTIFLQINTLQFTVRELNRLYFMCAAQVKFSIVHTPNDSIFGILTVPNNIS